MVVTDRLKFTSLDFCATSGALGLFTDWNNARFSALRLLDVFYILRDYFIASRIVSLSENILRYIVIKWKKERDKRGRNGWEGKEKKKIVCKENEKASVEDETMKGNRKEKK